MYLKLAVWPWPLVIHYELPYVDTWSAAWPWVLSATLVVAGTLVLIWRQRPSGFVAGSVLLILAPTSSCQFSPKSPQNAACTCHSPA